MNTDFLNILQTNELYIQKKFYDILNNSKSNCVGHIICYKKNTDIKNNWIKFKKTTLNVDNIITNINKNNFKIIFIQKTEYINNCKILIELLFNYAKTKRIDDNKYSIWYTFSQSFNVYNIIATLIILMDSRDIIHIPQNITQYDYNENETKLLSNISDNKTDENDNENGNENETENETKILSNISDNKTDENDNENGNENETKILSNISDNKTDENGNENETENETKILSNISDNKTDENETVNNSVPIIGGILLVGALIVGTGALFVDSLIKKNINFPSSIKNGIHTPVGILNLILLEDKENPIYYYVNTNNTIHILLTNKRFIKIENYSIRSKANLDQIKFVNHIKNSIFSFDKIEIIEKNGRRRTFGIDNKKVCRCFTDILNNITSAK